MIVIMIKRETGVNPVRSRHCDSQFFAKCHWKRFWEGAKERSSLSQETCLFLGKILADDRKFWNKTAGPSAVSGGYICLFCEISWRMQMHPLFLSKIE